jgi:hypothetical protein
MSTNSDSLYEAACRLPEPDLIALVSRLLERLPADSGGLTLDDPRLEEELNQRFADDADSVSWTTLENESS